VKLRAVLYDFDGTLADSTGLIMRCYRHTMSTHLDACPPDEEWLRGFGMPLEVQIRRFARSEAEFAAMMETYRAHQDAHHDAMLRPFPGALETVAELSRRGVPLGIVTSKMRRGTLAGLDLCGISAYFPVVVTPEDVTHAKPHPEPVLRALDLLGVAAAEAVFVGDSPHDMAAGRAAGTRTAAATWGPFPRESLERERPDVFLERQAEVVRMLEAG
jgi:pyrophosphatase PpaX